MKQGFPTRSWLRAVAATAALVMLGATFSSGADASCSWSAPTSDSAPRQPQPDAQQGGFISTAFMHVSDRDEASIVGLWRFTFTAQGNTGPHAPPDGAPIDAGYVSWHSDRTELMNSGRAPTTGDFCMGVWKQVGPATFRLNHFALAWEFDANTEPTAPGVGGADFTGPANIRELVTVGADGNHYYGTFTLVQYAADRKTVLASITGVVHGTRITVDSTVAD